MVIFLFTDFGHEGPYVGQVHAVLALQARGVPIIDLMHDAPAHDPRASAYLLAALAADFPERSVCCAVVDPGVGTERPPVVVEADRHWFVGPGNGLFELVQRRAQAQRDWRIRWRPEKLSQSFHGRDLFAPVAARIASAGMAPADWLEAATGDDPGQRLGAAWPDDLAEVIYADRFGNLMTGLRTETVGAATVLHVNGRAVRHARIFGEAPGGQPFWYGNSNGLVEIAAPEASAADLLGAAAGCAVGLDGQG
jgi:S-adenosyl-L-methionine hydrolase (adenosine-forming)